MENKCKNCQFFIDPNSEDPLIGAAGQCSRRYFIKYALRKLEANNLLKLPKGYLELNEYMNNVFKDQIMYEIVGKESSCDYFEPKDINS